MVAAVNLREEEVGLEVERDGEEGHEAKVKLVEEDVEAVHRLHRRAGQGG